MKKYRIKKVEKSVLRESDGKIETENLFISDTRLAMMFVKYMLKNIKYLKRYEYDTETYGSIINDLQEILKSLKHVDKTFKQYNTDEVGKEED